MPLSTVVAWVIVIGLISWSCYLHLKKSLAESDVLRLQKENQQLRNQMKIIGVIESVDGDKATVRVSGSAKIGDLI